LSKNNAQHNRLLKTRVVILDAEKLLPLVIAVDETLARRKGEHIAAKGMYRDAVRSSRSKVVTCLGLHWICMAIVF
jgi:hypothetical protein